MYRNLNIFITILAVLLLFHQIVIGQQDVFVWKNISSEKIYSKSVNDSFKIDIKLPDTYNDSTERYPLLIVLDGDILFPIAAGITHYLISGEVIPDMIIAGIGYGAFEWYNGNNRNRDYTAHPTPNRSFEGGASKFLDFIKSEFLPNIKNTYRIDTTKTILMGHSNGGHLVLYSFLNDSDLFTSYISSSPNISRWQEYFLQTIERNKDLLNSAKSKIFISVGANEVKDLYLDPIEKLVKKLHQATDEKNKIIFKKIENGEHFIVPNIALSYGLHALFRK